MRQCGLRVPLVRRDTDPVNAAIQVFLNQAGLRDKSIDVLRIGIPNSAACVADEYDPGAPRRLSIMNERAAEGCRPGENLLVRGHCVQRRRKQLAQRYRMVTHVVGPTTR